MIALGTPRYFFDELDSTMDTLNELARNGASEGTTVVTLMQRAGRGRAGRAWTTTPGSALLCSVLLRPRISPQYLGSFPLIVGVAIAEAIESIVEVTCQLKWPNDVYIEGRKVCGILAQTRALGETTEYINLGFGLNVSSRVDELPETATSLSIAVGRPIDRELVEKRVLARLSVRYGAFIEAGGAPALEDWLSRAAYLGEKVEIDNNHAIERGRFTGVSGNGALILETEAGRREFVAGDLTRGPRIEK